MTGPPNANPATTSSPVRQDLEELRTDFLEAVMRNAPYAIAVFDIHMRFLAANPRYLSENGLSEKDIVGRALSEVFPDLPEGWSHHYEKSLVGETEIHDFDEQQDERGKCLFRRISLPWYTANGSMGGIVVYDEDITEQKQTEARLNDQLVDLERFNSLSVERELRMRELKIEINSLLEELRRLPKYTITE